MHRHRLLPLLCLLLNWLPAFAQDHVQVYNQYVNAITLYAQQDTAGAMAGLEEVITLDPRHRDAIFNLAAMNLQTGHTDRAIDLLQVAVTLKDRAAANMLKQQLHQKIAYYDTMSLEDVDQRPTVLVKAKEKVITDEIVLFNAVSSQLVIALRRSNKLAGRDLLLWLYISKNGELNASLVNSSAEKAGLQEEVTKVLKAVKGLAPAQHEGKAVVVAVGLLPIRT